MDGFAVEKMCENDVYDFFIKYLHLFCQIYNKIKHYLKVHLLIRFDKKHT